MIYRFVFKVNNKLISVVSKTAPRALRKALIKYLTQQDYKGIAIGKQFQISLTYIAKFDAWDKKWEEKLK